MERWWLVSLSRIASGPGHGWCAAVAGNLAREGAGIDNLGKREIVARSDGVKGLGRSSLGGGSAA
jgi:hypothetical protein